MSRRRLCDSDVDSEDRDEIAVEFVGPHSVEIVAAEPITPGPGEVSVETTVSAVSAGTELLVYRDQIDGDVVADEQIPALDEPVSYPLRYGYATVGTVTDVGPGVGDDWRGRTVFGFNPHESRFLARPETLLVVPGDLDVERAALFANAETAVNFLLDGAPRIGERVAVFGQGVVGLLTTALLARSPVETVVAVEPHERRRELATIMGADAVVDPTAVDPVETVRDHTGGVDLAIEVSGEPDTLEDAISATRYDGRVLVGSWYGSKRTSLGLDDHYHRGRISIHSSQVSTIAPELRGRWDRERRRETAWRQLESIDVDPLITHRLPITAADEAYRLLDDRPDDAVQVLFTY